MILATYIQYQEHNTSMKLVAGRQIDRQTDQQIDRQTDIVTYRAAIAAKSVE